MIACLDHFVTGVEQEALPVLPAASCDDVESDLAICDALELAGEVDFSAAAAARCSTDFGGLCHLPPMAVVFPASADDVACVIRGVSRSRQLTVAVRGNGHSMAGQATAPGGVVMEMGALAGPVDIRRWRGGYVANVGGGVMWEEVLRDCAVQGLAPRSWTDYLRLTVGGTLSNAGVSGQAFRHGPQTANVAEMEVVTGTGEIVTCSDGQNSDLFHAVLGGLGQFGVITRARIFLEAAPDMVRWVRLVYSNFSVFTSDAESLVLAGDMFHYIEGFVFVNSDDPINGWGSVPIGNRRGSAQVTITAGAGPVLYCLEVAYYYRKNDGFNTVDKVVEDRLRRLRFVAGHCYQADVSYVDFLCRVNAAEAGAKAAGTWAAPHPWLNLFVSQRDIADFDRIVFKNLLSRGVGGPMLVYPLLRSKWDRRTSVVLPEVEVEAEEIFYLVALLRFNRPYPDGPAVEELTVENQAILDSCAAAGLAVKTYLPQYRSEEQWRRHFGKQWRRFVERKARYDPFAVLAPGQQIFARRSSAPSHF